MTNPGRATRRGVRGYDPFRSLQQAGMDDWNYINLLSNTNLAINVIRRTVQRSSIAQAILRQLAINVIGPQGPQPIFSSITNENDRGMVQDYWDTWSEYPTVEGRENWMQMMRALISSKMVDGRVFTITRRHTEYTHGIALMPLTREWLAERGSSGHVQTIKAPDGEELSAINGVCRAKSGRIRGYLFYDGSTPTKVINQNYYYNHGYSPLNVIGSGETIYVHTEDVRDYMVASTADDFDGRLLMMYPLVQTLKKVSKLDESLLIAMYAASCKLGFITKGEGAQAADMKGDEAYIPPERMDEIAVKLEELPMGYDFKSFDPSVPSMEQHTYRGEMVKNALAGIGIDYASATGDLRQVNYSSMRHGALSARDNYRLWQRDTQHLVAAPTLRQLLMHGAMFGQLTLQDERSLIQAKACDWRHKAWQWVDPIKDAQASQMLMSMGVTSPQQIAAALGVDYETVLREFKDCMETMHALGISPEDLIKISGMKKGAPPNIGGDKDPDDEGKG